MEGVIVLAPWRGLTVNVVMASWAVGSDRRSRSKLLAIRRGRKTSQPRWDVRW